MQKYTRASTLILSSLLVFVSSLASAANATIKEDIQILKGLMQSPIAISQPLLERSKTIKSLPFDQGAKISLDQCQKIETAIAKNYKLHGYKEEDGSYHLGVKLCPPTVGAIAIFDSEWMFPESVQLLYSQKPVKNQFGLGGAATLTVSYKLDNERIRVQRQYVLGAESRILQFNEVRYDDGYMFWNVTSVLDESGNVLSKTEKLWRNPQEPYLWKRSAAVASADGTVSSFIYTQNDGKGQEVSMGSFSAPFEVQWQAYEVSPITRLGGIYKIGDKTTTWLPKQSNYKLYSKDALACEEGYIGWDSNGNHLREFGSAESCRKILDTETIRP